MIFHSLQVNASGLQYSWKISPHCRRGAVVNLSVNIFTSEMGILLSAGKSNWATDFAHYYEKGVLYRGDAVSRNCARMIIDAAIHVHALKYFNKRQVS